MFNSIRSKLRSAISAVVLAATAGVQSIASVFNRNVTAPSIKPGAYVEPVAPRKPAFRTGIKGIKGTNNTRYGAALATHFQMARHRAVLAKEQA